MSWNLDPIRGVTSIILSIISLISIAFASFFYIENKYALKSNLKKIEIKLEMKIISDDSFRIRERIWDLKDRLKEDPDDKTAQEDILILTEERKQLEKKLDLLHKAEKSYK
ncbi:MAG: hypothetical protein D3910_05665 [Candidatus Electrothrix sp. ATG2]|nr:hypothetical protein [Candidatus Electrothrix sp. ATG2]